MNIKNLWLAVAVIALVGCSSSSDEDNPEEPTAAEICNADPNVMVAVNGVEFVRTPDECFERISDFDYETLYIEINGLRQAYIDEGPADADPILLLHGQPSWSYLYRKMIPDLVAEGHRVIAMDHVGLGRSDKPIDIEFYTYQRHTIRLEAFLAMLQLSDITLFVQDWGSLIGLQVAGVNSDRFSRIVVGNGSLPNLAEGTEPQPRVEDADIEDETLPFPFADYPDQQESFYDIDGSPLSPPDPGRFFAWMQYSMKNPNFKPSEVLEALTWFPLPEQVEAAYDAPYPSRIYMAGIRKFPSIINELPGEGLTAFQGLSRFDRPVLTIWGDNDPGGLGQVQTQQTLISSIPGSAGQPHTRLAEASHFLQEDQGVELARRVNAFIAQNPAPLITANYEPICTVYESGFQASRTIVDTQTGTQYKGGGQDHISFEEWDSYVPPSPFVKPSAGLLQSASSCIERSPQIEAGCIGQKCVDLVYVDGFEWFTSSIVRSSNCVPSTVNCTNPKEGDSGFLHIEEVEECRVMTRTGPAIELVDPLGRAYSMFRAPNSLQQGQAPTLPNGWSLRASNNAPLESTLLLPSVSTYPESNAGFCSHTVVTDENGAQYYGMQEDSGEPINILDRPLAYINEFFNYRYCEILLVSAGDTGATAEIWATVGQNRCPDPLWRAIDTAAIAMEQGVDSAITNGPRYWLYDASARGQPANPDNPSEVRTLGGIDFSLGGILEIDQAAGSEAYEIQNVQRDTVFYYVAGRRVYELQDPLGNRYMMQSMSQIVDPTLDIDDLITLGDRLALPDGWTYSSRILDAPFDLETVDGIAAVVQDDLSNTYQVIPQ